MGPMIRLRFGRSQIIGPIRLICPIDCTGR